VSEVTDLRAELDRLYDLLNKLWMERKPDGPPLSLDETAQVKEALVQRMRWVEKTCVAALLQKRKPRKK